MCGRMTDQATRTGRKRPGRPPGPLDSVRPNRVVTFVTGPELRRLTELADSRGKSLSAIVRDLVSLGLEQCEPLTSDESGES